MERQMNSFEEMNYKEFLQTKIEIAPESGFEIQTSAVNSALKPHQKDAVKWALRGGRRALFEIFWVGKNSAGDRILPSGSRT